MFILCIVESLPIEMLIKTFFHLSFFCEGLFPPPELPAEKVTSVVECRLWKPILRHGTCAGINPCSAGTMDDTSAEAELVNSIVILWLVSFVQLQR